MKIKIVIPARLASTRLPEKPLIDINGKSLIERTYLQCIKAFDRESVYVATDSEKIYNHCQEKGMHVLMTSEKCLTGTDRIAEFATLMPADYYINVQGDEPLTNPNDILSVINAISERKGSIINGYASIENEEDYFSNSIPKVVFRPDGRLLYMSRSPIPGNKQNRFIKSWRQICIYAFPKEALLTFAAKRQKTTLEEMEDIEILRFLEMGYEVHMIQLSGNSIAVDTPEDVKKVKKALLYDN